MDDGAERLRDLAAVAVAADDGPAPLVEATARVLAAGPGLRTVVLVEGVSDQIAVEATAERRGRDLVAEGVVVVAMGGVTNIGRFVRLFGPQGLDAALAGLCDEREASTVQRALAGAGLRSGLDRGGMEALGFHVCAADLEDELIRALGPDSVLQVVHAEGELKSFRRLQQQPAQQGRSVEQQLRRFVGTRGGRKIRYARLLVDALDLTKVPRPLEALLEGV